MDKDVEALSKYLADKFTNCQIEKKHIYYTDWEELATNVNHLIRISEVRARLHEEMVYGGSKRHERITELTAELKKLEETG